MKNLNDNKKVSIVTVTLECKEKDAPTNNYRDEILEKVLKKFGTKDIILLPARFYGFPPAYDLTKESKIVDYVRNLLIEINSDAIVCLGIDAGEKGKKGNEQIAVAINKSGIVAKGRKWCPEKDEKRTPELAESFDSKESGYERIFECKGKRFYLAVCYDVFGIRKLKEKAKTGDMKIDAVLSLAHYFIRSGKGSGYSYFISRGFGGASLHWDCPVIGAAVFFERNVPEKWQPGFKCKDNVQSAHYIKYGDNELFEDCKPEDCDISTEYEKAFCYLYTI